MKRLLLATSLVTLLALGIYVASCGEVDPAYAPVGSSISLLSEGQTWEYGCSDFGLPSSCWDAYRNWCIAACSAALINGSMPDDSDAAELYEDCQGEDEACAEYVCDDYNQWTDYCAIIDVLRDVGTYIQSKEGRCGYKSFIITAIVTGEAKQLIAEGGDEVATPMNGVEVRWITSGGEMYELDDVPGTIPPLSNPFYDETDERGLSDIKLRVPLPNGCGYEVDYVIDASIGVSTATAEFSMSAEEGEFDDDTF